MMDYNDISDEALSAYLEGNASPEEIELILAMAEGDPDIAEALDIVSESIAMFGDFEDEYSIDTTPTEGTEITDAPVETNVHDLMESNADDGSFSDSMHDLLDGGNDTDTQGFDSFDGNNDTGDQPTFDFNP